MRFGRFGFAATGGTRRKERNPASHPYRNRERREVLPPGNRVVTRHLCMTCPPGNTRPRDRRGPSDWGRACRRWLHSGFLPGNKRCRRSALLCSNCCCGSPRPRRNTCHCKAVGRSRSRCSGTRCNWTNRRNRRFRKCFQGGSRPHRRCNPPLRDNIYHHIAWSLRGNTNFPPDCNRRSGRNRCFRTRHPADSRSPRWVRSRCTFGRFRSTPHRDTCVYAHHSRVRCRG